MFAVIFTRIRVKAYDVSHPLGHKGYIAQQRGTCELPVPGVPINVDYMWRNPGCE